MISSTDWGWLAKNHPDLTFFSEENYIVGELAFSMYYNQEYPKQYVINPSKDYANLAGETITDVYEIIIDFNTKLKIPNVFETGGRIESSAQKWEIASLLDLHVYDNKNLCLCIPVEWDLKLPNGFNLPDFFTNLLIPYFYYQSFFERYGKEPWKGYGHGEIGLLESFYERTITNNLSSKIINMYVDALSPELKQKLLHKVNIKGHHPCLCGSGKKIRNCHQEAQFGFVSLSKYYHAAHLDTNSQ